MLSDQRKQRSFGVFIIFKLVVDAFVLSLTWNIECDLPWKYWLLALMITTFVAEYSSTLKENNEPLKILSFLAFVVLLGLNLTFKPPNQCMTTNPHLYFYCDLNLLFQIPIMVMVFCWWKNWFSNCQSFSCNTCTSNQNALWTWRAEVVQLDYHNQADHRCSDFELDMERRVWLAVEALVVILDDRNILCRILLDNE